MSPKISGAGVRRDEWRALLFRLTVFPVILFTVEMGIMRLLAMFNLEGSPTAPVLDSLALLLVMAPFVYLLFIKPMRRELEEKKARSASIDKLNNILMTLRDCNHALARAVNEQQLMDDVCRILNEKGGYRMAWVGLAEHDAEKMVKPAAYRGHNEGYVETLNMTWADTERGQSPVGSAIRTGKPAIVAEMASDARLMRGAAAEAIKRGYASMTALPLAVDEAIIGSLNVYSEEAGAFGAEEMHLLTELAGDLSFGVRYQRIRKELEASEKKLGEIVSLLGEGVYMQDAGGRLAFLNPAAERMLGWKKEELRGKDFHETIHHLMAGEAGRHQGDCPIIKAVLAGTTYRGEGEIFMRKDGGLFPVKLVATPVLRDGAVAGCVAAFEDISERKKIEADLNASEKRYRELVDNAIVGVVQTTLDGKFLYANSAILRMFEVGPLDDYLSSLAPERWKNPEDRIKMVDTLKSSGRASYEVEMVTNTGKTITVLFNSVLLGDGISTVMVDLTDRKRSAEALRTSGERLMEAQRIAKLGSLDWDLIANEVECSDEALRIYGLGAERRKFTFEEIAKLVHPDDVDRVAKSLNDAIEKGSEHRVEHRIVRPDGKVVYVDANAKVVRDAGGKPIRVFGTNLDVTERKLAEIALQDQEELLRALTYSARDSIIMLDDRGTVLLWNKSAEEKFGWRGDEVVGGDLASFIVPPKFRDAHRKGVESFREKGKGGMMGKTVELTAVKKGGAEFPMELSLSSFQMKGRWNYVGVIRDVSERKAAEQLIFRQEKLASIGTLSAGVAHEILNPLNIIGTIVQLMQTGELPDETKEELNEIMTQVRRATKITNNLRMFAHAHDKREITSVDVHALFEKTVLLMEHDLNLDNITVDRDYAQNFPPIFADPDLLAQVFLNLLNNARHALQEVKDDRKKRITVGTKVFADSVDISLSDNGPRIPEDIIGKIFDPFFTTKDPDKGTGLGLSMAYSFIKDFGGSMTVRNEEPEGVTFIITLPSNGGRGKNREHTDR